MKIFDNLMKKIPSVEVEQAELRSINFISSKIRDTNMKQF